MTQKTSLLTMQDIDKIIDDTTREIFPTVGNAVEPFAKIPETEEEGFFTKIVTSIADSLRKIKVYGRDKIKDAINHVTGIIENAKNALKEKFEEMLQKVEEFLAALFSNYMKTSLALIPKKIEQENQGIFKLNKVTFSRTIALESGVTASLTKFFEMVVSGELSFEAEYNYVDSMIPNNLPT